MVLETIATINEYTPKNERIRKFWLKHGKTETRHIHTITYNGITNDIELDHSIQLTNVLLDNGLGIITFYILVKAYIKT
jgi:hypothetical protein